MSQTQKFNIFSSCRGICSYYDANSKIRKGHSAIFRKWCQICALNLISKLNTCPCCHSQTRKEMLT